MSKNILRNILERIEYMKDNVNDLTVDEKLMQFKIISKDMEKISDGMRKREVVFALADFAKTDLDCVIKFEIQYYQPKEEE